MITSFDQIKDVESASRVLRDLTGPDRKIHYRGAFSIECARIAIRLLIEAGAPCPVCGPADCSGDLCRIAVALF